MMIFNSPLVLPATTKRKFILNLNNYRNTHYRILNGVKIKYKEFMKEQILSLKSKLNKCCIIYTVYKGDKRNFDIGNICSVHQKFFEDALVELGRLEDDRYINIPMCVFCMGGIDPENPRVVIEVVEYKRGFKNKILDMVKKIVERLY